jgi:hypothetical protein
MFPELITDLLQEGYKVSFNAPGHSMFPTIMANETIVVEPIDPGTVRMGDIILYRTNGRLIAHRVVGINVPLDDGSSSRSDPEAQSSGLSPHCLFILRGDASPACDAPVKAGQILGKVVSIQRNGRSIEPYSFKYKIGCLATVWSGRIKRLPRRIFSIFFLWGG